MYGKKKDEWVKTAKEHLKNFKGGIPVSGRLIKVNKNSRNEFVKSRYSQGIEKNDIQKYKDRLSLSGNIDEIVLASTNYVNQDLKHDRKDNVIQFAVGDVLFKIGKRNFNASVVIGFTSNSEMLLYDIVDIMPTNFTIKNDGVLQSRTGQANSLPAYRIGTPTINSQSQSDPVTNNVSYNTDVVNNKNSLPQDNNSTQVNTRVISDVVIRASIRYGLDNVDEEAIKTISFSQRDIDERKGWNFRFEDNTVRSRIQDRYNNSLHLSDTVIFESNDSGNISYGTGRILDFVPSDAIVDGQSDDVDYFYSFAIEKGNAPQALDAVVNDKVSPTFPDSIINQDDDIVNSKNSLEEYIATGISFVPIIL